MLRGLDLPLRDIGVVLGEEGVAVDELDAGGLGDPVARPVDPEVRAIFACRSGPHPPSTSAPIMKTTAPRLTSQVNGA